MSDNNFTDSQLKNVIYYLYLLKHDAFGFERYVGRKRKGVVVAPSAPKTEAGLYWGYATRLAANLSAVFTESPYIGGYDLIIGTSERGNSVDDFVLRKFK